VSVDDYDRRAIAQRRSCRRAVPLPDRAACRCGGATSPAGRRRNSRASRRGSRRPSARARARFGTDALRRKYIADARRCGWCWDGHWGSSRRRSRCPRRAGRPELAPRPAPRTSMRIAHARGRGHRRRVTASPPAAHRRRRRARGRDARRRPPRAQILSAAEQRRWRAPTARPPPAPVPALVDVQGGG